MTSERPVRTAIVGYGLAGSAFHAPLVATTPGLELAAVVTRDPARAAAAVGRYPTTRVLAHPDDVWAMAGELDLVVVATTNDSHVPLALAALDAGLAVVVDKPVATTAADARRLAVAANAAGRPVAAYHNRRYDGDFRTLADLIDGGRLGVVRRFESRFERWRPDLDPAKWRESGDRALGGGLLLDLGSHLVDQALTLFGPVESVYAELAARRPGARVEDDVFLALTHRGGVLSHLWASAVAADLGPRFRVIGSLAAYVKLGLDPQEDALRAGATPLDPGYGEEPADRHGRLGAGEAWTSVATKPGVYQAFYAAMRDAVRGGGPVPVSLDEAIAGLDVLDAARRSAAQGIAVRIG